MTISLAEQAAALFQLSLTTAQVAQFETYAHELAAWNAHTNLTAITAPEAVQVRHFLDSLSLAQAVSFYPGMRVMDVGAGAGFPGLPLKIAFPNIHLTLLEATGKKVAFLKHIVQTLGLTGVETLHARAEEAGHMPGQRGSYDLVAARSVARLPSLVEYLLPLAKLGGQCIAMKGLTAADEAAAARRALTILGGRVRQIEAVQLPGVADVHYLILIEKIAHTPSAYPRKPGTPTQKPLA
jgi:16S rRNA (guanine527-N7)-methyltransferase